MQIDDTQTWSEVHKKNIIYKISTQYVKACRIKVRNIVAAFQGMHVSPAKHSYAWLPRKCDYQESVTTGQTDGQTDAGQSDPYVQLCFAGDTKTVYFMHSRFQKGQCSYEYWRKSTTFKLDLKFIKWKSYTEFQLNMSKHVGEKCGRLCISSILTSKRGIAPSTRGARVTGCAPVVSFSWKGLY